MSYELAQVLTMVITVIAYFWGLHVGKTRERDRITDQLVSGDTEILLKHSIVKVEVRQKPVLHGSVSLRPGDLNSGYQPSKPPPTVEYRNKKPSPPRNH